MEHEQPATTDTAPLTINGTLIDRTFAEAFPMKARGSS